MRWANCVDCLLLMTTAMSTVSNSTSSTDQVESTFSHGHELINVNISIYVKELRIIDAKQMLLQMSCILKEEWYDGSLAYNNVYTRKMAVSSRIWNPKVGPTSGASLLGDHQRKESLFWRSYGQNGHVLHSEMFLINVHCTHDLRKFPFDINVCSFKFGTFRFPMDEVLLTWKEPNPVTFSPENSHDLIEFWLFDYATRFEYESHDIAGNFSRLVLDVVIHRNSLHYVICTIIPAIVAVLLNYAIIWFERSTDRILSAKIFCFSYLLYAYYETSCSDDTTKVNYMKALDLFLLISLSFLLIALFRTYIHSVMSENLLYRRLCLNRRFKFCFKLWYFLFYGLSLALLYYYCNDSSYPGMDL